VCLADCGCAGVRAGCGLLVRSKSKSQEDMGGIGGRLQAVVAMCYKEGGSVGARGVMGVNQTARKRGGGCRNGRQGSELVLAELRQHKLVKDLHHAGQGTKGQADKQLAVQMGRSGGAVMPHWASSSHGGVQSSILPRCLVYMGHGALLQTAQTSVTTCHPTSLPIQPVCGHHLPPYTR
jgi:hypothetical protein